MNIRALLAVAMVATTVSGCGGDGGSSTEPEPNRPPDLQGIENASVVAGESMTRTLIATDQDGDRLTFLVVENPGFLSVQNQVWNGSVSTATLMIAPPASMEGTYNGTVRITDTGGLSDDASLTIDVIRPNRAPRLASIPGVTVSAGGTASTPLSATDEDGDQLSFSVTNNPGFVSVQNASQSGNTATATLVMTPPDGSEGSFDATVRVSDGQGGSDEENVHIEVTAASQTQLFLDYVNSADILSNRQRTMGNVRLTVYGTAQHDWTATLGDALAGDTYGFVLWLGAGTGTGQTGTFTMSIRIRHQGSTTEVASRTFTVPYNTQFIRYDATVTGARGVGVAGDDIILHMSVAGVSEAAVLYGSTADSHILVPGDVSVSASSPAPAPSEGGRNARLQKGLGYRR